jgi:hypothetical protein
LVVIIFYQDSDYTIVFHTTWINQNIKPFLEQLVKSNEESEAMKLVVLGHSQIGNTTMLHAIKKLIALSHTQVKTTIILFCCLTLILRTMLNKNHKKRRLLPTLLGLIVRPFHLEEEQC